MPYIIKKTNGQTLATIGDASLDTTTDLSLVGRNYAGYGEIFDQNLVKMLENFANSTPPSNPLVGELWYNTNNNSLNVYNGATVGYKSLANVFIQSTIPTISNNGDLWYDTVNQQLKVYNGSSYILIGPTVSAQSNGVWNSENVYPVGDSNPTTALEAFIGTQPIAVISNNTFIPNNSVLDTNFGVVKPGITLSNADPVTGVSASNTYTGFLLWGTAAHSLTANTANVSSTVSISDAESGTFYIPLSSSGSGSTSFKTNAGIKFDTTAQVLHTTATAATYADLAERYHADEVYEVGTVVVIGGKKEITVTDIAGHLSVAGVISDKPAYMMNAEAGNDKTHPYVALKGRVMCKAIGPINKGDALVTSNRPGYAKAYSEEENPRAIFAIAITALDGGPGLVEVKV
jgi:hypothetical protein